MLLWSIYQFETRESLELTNIVIPAFDVSVNWYFLATMYRHEIVGTVTEVGSAVKNFKVGETVGVGCLVHSCHNCDSCEKGLEQYCDSLAWTYNDVLPDGTVTQGGYSNVMVVNHK